MSAAHLQQLRESFFKTVFSLLGHIANCDGYINRDEIKRTQTYMEKMHLTVECKREAIKLFRVGASPQFDMVGLLKEFSASAEKTPTIIEVLLVYLISLARIDGLLVEKEINVVRKVADELKYSTIIFDHLLRMVSAQDKFESSSDEEQAKSTNNKFNGNQSRQQSQQKSQQQSRQNFQQNKDENYFSRKNYGSAGEYLDAAYESLGIARTAGDEELKKAYRKLVSQFHPDKLQGQGLPLELVKTATERFKKIQGAYDYIQKFKKAA